METGGKVGAAGSLSLNLNPPKAEESGANFTSAWVKVELVDDGSFSATLYGEASYDAPDGGTDTAGTPTLMKRSATWHEPLTDTGLAPLKDVLAQVLSAYSNLIKTKTLAAAFEARSLAHNVDRPKGGK